MSNLEKSILSTIVYFDVFNYPLTLVEIWRWLFVDSELKNPRTEERFRIFDVQEILDKSEFLRARINSKQGFYFLKDRDEIINLRKEKYDFAERKFNRVIKIIKIVRHFPFIKMMAVCNTLAYSNCRDEGDIDLFIICEKNHIWQTRFFVTGLLKILGLRPEPDKTKDKICPSFFISEDNLNLEKIKIDDDMYLIYWISQVFPVYDQGYYEKFLSANSWINKYIPNVFDVKPSLRRKVYDIKAFRYIFRPFFSLFSENFCRHYQLKVLPENLKKMANKDTRVVVNDQMLKFHDNDGREKFKKMFLEKFNIVGSP